MAALECQGLICIMVEDVGERSGEKKETEREREKERGGKHDNEEKPLKSGIKKSDFEGVTLMDFR